MSKKRSEASPLSGKIAIVTGASRGVGKGIATPYSKSNVFLKKPVF